MGVLSDLEITAFQAEVRKYFPSLSWMVVPLPHNDLGAEARFYAASEGRVIAVLPDRPDPQIFPAPYSSHVEGQIQWFDRAIESCLVRYKVIDEAGEHR